MTQPEEEGAWVLGVVSVPEGLVVLVGCSHPGILNMVSHIAEKTGEKILAVFGGTHLVDADEERIRRTVRALCDLGLTELGLSHCSGDGVDALMEAEPQVRSRHLCPGDSIRFG